MFIFRLLLVTCVLLQRESLFLSTPHTRNTLPSILSAIRHNLNVHGLSIISVGKWKLSFLYSMWSCIFQCSFVNVFTSSCIQHFLKFLLSKVLWLHSTFVLTKYFTCLLFVVASGNNFHVFLFAHVQKFSGFFCSLTPTVKIRENKTCAKFQEIQ